VSIVPPRDGRPVDGRIALASGPERRFGLWLDQLRACDLSFAEASTLHPADAGEWQAGVYLLTGCEPVWLELGGRVLAERSLQAAVDELDQPRRWWSPSEDTAVRWAAHFWDVRHCGPGFPSQFGHFLFRRWINACHLYKRTAPTITITNGSPR
jgi:hypothetical protein